MSAALLVSCGTTKKAVSTSVPTSQIKTVTSLENTEVREVERVLSDIEIVKVLSEDGTKMVDMPMKWFAGTYKSNNQRVAIEAAQRDAYNTIAREVQNEVMTKGQVNAMDNNSEAREAFRAFSNQVAQATIRGCGPFGKTEIQYDPATGMYTVWAKVALQGDQYRQLIKTAGEAHKEGLSGESLDSYLEAFNKVMEATTF